MAQGFDAGSATGRYILDISDAERKAKQLKQLFAGIAADAAKVSKASVGGGSPAATASTNAHTRALAQLRNSEIAAARAAGDHARALKIIEAELGRASQGTVRYNQLLAQQSRAQAAAARVSAAGLGTAGGLPILPRTLERFGGEALGQIKSGLLGIVGPAALVTAGFAALGTAIDLTEQGFKLKARLDETTQSIRIQLRGVRDSGEIFQQASVFAAQYGLTQEETNAALRSSVSILRQSTSSASDLLGVLTRLQIASPEQGLEGAALAVKELQSGDIQSLVERFEISRSAANKMKEEIKGGADAVTVLSKYLTDSGIGMEALENRTSGAAGKMRLLAQESEKFSLALGGQAGGPGEFILDQRIALLANATRVLSGDTKTLIQDVGGLAVALNPLASATTLVGVADDFLIGKFNQLAGTSIPSVFEPLKVMTDEWFRLIGAIDSTPSSLPGSQRLKEDLRSITREANAAADAVAAALGKPPLPHISDRGPTVGGAVGGLGARLTSGATRTAAASRAEDQQAARLQDVLFDNQLKRAKDNAAKIALLRSRLAKTTDVVERAQIEGQIIDLQNASGTARVRSATSTATKLNDIARTSGTDRLRIERENLERLRDQQEDFDVRSARSKEDFERQRLKLLAEGNRIGAAELEATFAREQRRELEDFQRQKRRTNRNNAEGLGDLGARVGDRVEKLTGGQIAGEIPLPGAAVALPTGGITPTVIQINVNAQTNLDGQRVGDLIFDVIQQRLDETFSIELRAAPALGSSQTSVAGARP
jgi:hypothetical protein